VDKRPATESGGTTAPAAERRTIGDPIGVPVSPVGAGRRMSLTLIGLIMAAIGAWAAIVAFAGPAFGFSLDGDAAWHWSGHRVLLSFAPGVAAAVAGLLVISTAMRLRRSGRAAGGMLVLCGLIAIAAGGWLVVGQDVWSTLRSPNPTYYDSPSQWIHFTRVVGMHLGPGVILCALGGLSMGLAMLGGRRIPATAMAPAARPAAELQGAPARPVRSEERAARTEETAAR